MMLLDMGYISWFHAWHAGHTYTDPSWYWLDQQVAAGATLCFDSSTSHRKAAYPWYKSLRSEWEEQYGKAEMRDYAHNWAQRAFQRYPRRSLEFEGWESDDILAMRYNQNSPIMSLDKDFLQLPGVSLVDMQGNAWGFERLQRKVKSNISSSERMLAYQLLHGDQTDCIPRTIPSADRKTIPAVMATDTPLESAIKVIGEELARKHLDVLLVPTPLITGSDSIQVALKRYGYSAAQRRNYG